MDGHLRLRNSDSGRVCEQLLEEEKKHNLFTLSGIAGV
jgi:hypothetical protein